MEDGRYGSKAVAVILKCGWHNLIPGELKRKLLADFLDSWSRKRQYNKCLESGDFRGKICFQKFSF